eukprot:TRINITY_DN4005_c0_g5_i1.p1 TRINITY_DN4005_c0_g5~~TRINITY_DN4005_c0_g5_i1.p1  ORF type:complete len:864 (+),score=214.73 TRINITY_DN4005_c0_g5_i1:63-2594(+)
MVTREERQGGLPHFCGLVNQGATCYLNSLLQALYHLKVFRDALFMLPVDKDPVAKALQSLFYKMETSVIPVSTEILTDSFGWDSYESYKQHDVQELLQVLVADKIESCFKKYSPEHNVVKELFTGIFSSYIKVTDPTVQYENCVDEPYTDIQLNIKNHDKSYNTTIVDCLRAFQAEDQLCGPNQYELEQGGKKSLHDAVKGMRIKTFPDILFLHLKRFRQDLYGRAEKVFERLSYDEELDVSDFSPCPCDDNIYTLFAVMVHKGSSASFGHYYSYIHVGLKEWVKFDDTRVSRATRSNAIEENFGGSTSWHDNSHAYLLVYIRRSRAEHIINAPSRPRSDLLLKTLTASTHDNDVAKSPGNYNKISVVRRKDIEEAVREKCPTDARGFMRSLKGITLYHKKSADVTQLKKMIAEAVEMEEGQLQSYMLKCTERGCEFVEACHMVYGGDVYYVHDTIFDSGHERFAFLFLFVSGKLLYVNPVPAVMPFHTCREITKRCETPVGYNIQGEPIASSKGHIAVVCTNNDNTEFKEHQEASRDRGTVLLKGPSDEDTEISYSKTEHKRITLEVLQLLLPQMLGLDTSTVEVSGDAYKGWSWKHKEFVEALPGSVRNVLHTKEVQVYSDNTTCVGIFTLYLSQRFEISVQELVDAVVQLPQKALSCLKDGQLMAVVVKNNEIASMHTEGIIEDYGLQLRVQPVPDLGEGDVMVKVSHYTARGAFGNPFVHVIDETTSASSLLAHFKHLLCGTPLPAGSTQDDIDIPLHSYSRQSAPVRQRNSDYVNLPPKCWPEGDDSARWTVEMGVGYASKPFEEGPVARQLESKKTIHIKLVHEKRKSRSSGFVIKS